MPNICGLTRDRNGLVFPPKVVLLTLHTARPLIQQRPSGALWEVPGCMNPVARVPTPYAKPWLGADGGRAETVCRPGAAPQMGPALFDCTSFGRSPSADSRERWAVAQHSVVALQPSGPCQACMRLPQGIFWKV